MPLAMADALSATPFASVAVGPPPGGIGKAATEEEGMTVLEVRRFKPCAVSLAGR